jgi:hypothetical protein
MLQGIPNPKLNQMTKFSRQYYQQGQSISQDSPKKFRTISNPCSLYLVKNAIAELINLPLEVEVAIMLENRFSVSKIY